MVLTDDQKRDFIRDGYIVIRGAVPLEKVIAARQHATKAYKEGKYRFKNKRPIAPNFDDDVQRAPEITSIPGSTILQEACDDLLGDGNAKWGKAAQIAFRLTDQKFLDEGMGMTDPQPKHSYHVDGGDGKYQHNGTPFTVLMGVCLSGGQMKDENRGQLNVWPGSHVTLHEIIKERIHKGLVDGASTLYGGEGKNRPDIGLPLRVRLKPGDAVLAHQRLGHSGGINLWEKPRKNLYFRVRHKRHDELLEQAWSGSLWTEFEGLHHLVDYKPQTSAK